MEKTNSKISSPVSFPVVIHQTNNAYYLKIGDSNSKPQDFKIIIDNGKLVISSSKENSGLDAKTFLHTVSGQQVDPPVDQKRYFRVKAERISKLFQVFFGSVKTIKME